MKTIIVYPVPMETPEVWETFKPFIKRFTDSMRKVDPGCDYELVPILNFPVVDIPPHLGEVEEMLQGLPGTTRPCYLGKGCDIGSFLFYAKNVATENVFQVNCVSRVYAWKDGWLKRLVDAREMFGPGLYGTSVNTEHQLHVCCRCYAADSDIFKLYPHQIESRARGPFFEVGDGNLTKWVKSENLVTKVVYWGWTCEVRDGLDSPCFSAPNIFRRGDQSNILVKDKHPDMFDNSDAGDKKALSEMTYGKSGE